MMTRLCTARAPFIAIVCASLLSIAAGGDAFSQTRSRSAIEIRTLSSRPDLVSGGDTLIAVRVPPRHATDQITVTLNGKDVTARLSFDAASGEYRGAD